MRPLDSSPPRPGRRRLRIPEGFTPPGLNHAILTGRLAAFPRLGRNPVGEAVTALTVEFPVVDPERPHRMWTWASCEVEVGVGLADRHGVGDLEGGASVLVAGQLSERWAIEDGRTSKRAALVAALVVVPNHVVHPDLLGGSVGRVGRRDQAEVEPGAVPGSQPRAISGRSSPWRTLIGPLSEG